MANQQWIDDFNEDVFFRARRDRYNEWRFELDEIARGVINDA